MIAIIDFEKMAKNSYSLNCFTDFPMRNAIKDFTYAVITSDDYVKATDKVLDYRVRYLFSCSYGFWGNCKLSDITIDFGISKFNQNLHSSYFSVATRFLIFACEKELISCKEFKRLLFFKDRFSLNVTNSDVLYVLQDKYFDVFEKKGFFSSSDWLKYQLYFERIDTSNFKDEFIGEAITNTFIDLKLNENYKTGSKINQCRGYREVAYRLLSDKHPKEITKDAIIDTIEHNDYDKYDFYPSIPRIIEDLANKGIKLNYDVLYFVRTINQYGSQNKNTLLNCLQVDDLTKWHLKKTLDKSNGLFYMGISSKEVRDIWNEFVDIYMHSNLGIKTVCSEFDISLGKNSVERIQDLNFYTFKAQVLYFSKYNVKRQILAN